MPKLKFLYKVQSLGHSSRLKYPYFWKIHGFSYNTVQERWKKAPVPKTNLIHLSVICGDITWGVKFHKGTADHDHAPFRQKFYIGRVGLAMLNQCTKFEVSRFTHYEAMNGGAKCRKWSGLGRLGVTQGQPQCHHSIVLIRLVITTTCLPLSIRLL